MFFGRSFSFSHRWTAPSISPIYCPSIVSSLVSIPLGSFTEMQLKSACSLAMLTVTDALTVTTSSSSFMPAEFKPKAPGRNRHVQTILGSLYRDIPTVAGRTEAGRAAAGRAEAGDEDDGGREEDVFWDDSLCIPTTDGDSFRVDVLWNPRGGAGGESENSNGKPLHVLLLHGLESSSDSNLIKSIAVQMVNVAGATSVRCLNFRCCTNDLQQATPGGYHLGFTDDLRGECAKNVAP